MATLQEIIRRAFREQQITASGELPSAAQEAEGLELLQGILLRSIIQKPQSMITLGAKPIINSRNRQRDFTPISRNLAVPPNVYIHCSLTEPLTIYMPFNAGDGARLTITDVAGNFASVPLTLDGNKTLINGALEQVLATNNMRLDLFFRRDVGDWRTLSPLLLTSLSPFQEEYDDMFVIELAARLASRYGKVFDPVTAQLREDMRDRFLAQYKRTSSDVEADVLFEAEFVPYDTTGAVDSASQRILR